METFSCWVCGINGMGKIEDHECNLNHFNSRISTWLDTPQGSFLVYMARRILNASGSTNLPLAKS
jgi:hypothetical protein